jgi:serine/threonine protein kinase
MLASRRNLGPYEILSLIAVGGMAEVSKASDTRLDHIVAMKVSKSAFSERFEREARAVAELYHPPICTFPRVGQPATLRPKWGCQSMVRRRQLNRAFPICVRMNS